MLNYLIFHEPQPDIAEHRKRKKGHESTDSTDSHRFETRVAE